MKKEKSKKSIFKISVQFSKVSTIEKSDDRQGATELINDDYFKSKSIDIEKSIQTKEINVTPNKDNYEPEL